MKRLDCKIASRSRGKMGEDSDKESGQSSSKVHEENHCCQSSIISIGKSSMSQSDEGGEKQAVVVG
jgi:hypothetical protein